MTRIIKRSILFTALIVLACSCINKAKQLPPLVDSKNHGSDKRLIEANRILIKKDQQRIVAYIDRQNWNMTESGTGLWTEILIPGSGDSIQTDTRISMKYKISLLDGTECYNSESDGIKTFTVGRGSVEAGLEQGVLMLREGAKARFIMPPHLAQGLTGDGVRIPARATIIYEIELIN